MADYVSQWKVRFLYDKHQTLDLALNIILDSEEYPQQVGIYHTLIILLAKSAVLAFVTLQASASPSS